MYAYLVLGTHSEGVVESEGTEIVIALGGHFKASMDEVQRTVEALPALVFGDFWGDAKGAYVVCGEPL